MKVNEIPSSRDLGTLPSLADWHIRVRTWRSQGAIQYQFSVAHAHGWLYEYRHFDNGKRVSYWSPGPQSKKLRGVIEEEVSDFLSKHWDWVTCQ